MSAGASSKLEAPKNGFRSSSRKDRTQMSVEELSSSFNSKIRVRLWIQQRPELPCASSKFQGIGCSMIGDKGDGVSNWTTSGSIENEEVSLVDGVLEGALGALGDEIGSLGDGVVVSS
ncbi:hypothetical protein Tco_0233108 [Tanacetum coccineum]